MSKINDILVDMDGVLFNFVKGFCLFHDLKIPERLKTWDMEDELGITKGEFYKKLNEMNHKCWATLDPIAHGFKMMEYLQTLDKNIYFCSSPSDNPESWSGKKSALIEHFPKLHRNLVLTHHKHLLAKESALLIDDSQRNVDLFKAHGGNSIAFPQSYNNNSYVADKSYFVQRTMELSNWHN